MSKKYINPNDDSDFSQFCKGHCEDIQAVLDYIEKLENIIKNF